MTVVIVSQNLSSLNTVTITQGIYKVDNFAENELKCFTLCANTVTQLSWNDIFLH